MKHRRDFLKKIKNLNEVSLTDPHSSLDKYLDIFSVCLDKCKEHYK